MAVVVDYKKVKGWYIMEQEGAKFKVMIHTANCLGACIYHYKVEGKKMVQLRGFWNDIKHLTNALGLTGSDPVNIYIEYEHVKEIHINIYYKDMLKVAEAFAKSGIKTIIYYKEEKRK